MGDTRSGHTQFDALLSAKAALLISQPFGIGRKGQQPKNEKLIRGQFPGWEEICSITRWGDLPFHFLFEVLISYTKCQSYRRNWLAGERVAAAAKPRGQG